MKRRTRILTLGGLVVTAAVAVPSAVYANQASPNSLVSIRNATRHYTTFANSQSDGFTTLVTNQQTQATCIANGSAGAMGQHYANGGRVGDGVIDKQRPEVLLYEPQSDGSKKLVGVEYVVIADAWMKSHSSPPVLFGKEFGLTTANPFGLPPFYALHAWAWQSNPSGDFSGWNPTVTCP